MRPNHPTRCNSWSWLKLALAVALLPSLLPTAGAWADTVWIRSSDRGNALPRPKVTVLRVEGDKLFFRAASGDETSRPLAQVFRVQLDDDPVFSAAEEAFSNKKWDPAIESYRKTLETTTTDWIKLRATLRLVEAANKSGAFPAAVSGYVALYRLNPELAARNRPAVPPRSKAGSLNEAVAEVEKAVNDTSLDEAARRTLRTYLINLYRANGQAEEAAAEAKKLSGAPAPTPEDGAVGANPDTPPTAADSAAQAETKLALAKVALDQNQPDKALREIQSARAVFTEPPQQVEALYCIAEAQARLAGNKRTQLTDAALAYMRVVALAATANLESPRVPEALFKTAAIQEKLGVLPEALLLYQQVSQRYKETDWAAQAATGVTRVQKALQQAESK